MRRYLLTGCAVLAALAAATIGPAVASASGGVSGRAHTTGIPLNVRSGPSTGNQRVATIADGASIVLVCRVSGEQITGAVRRTADWDRLPDGHYVSDAYVVRSRRPDACGANTPPAIGSARPTVEQARFLATAAPLARRGMSQYGVPASVTMAQAILESGWGASALSVDHRNYFGIKCFDGYHGPFASGCHTYKTHECDKKGKCWTTRASFRTYASMSASFRDHGSFLVSNSRYQGAFRYSHQPDRFAQAIARAGYATSPTYAASLIRLMREYNLYRYDG